MLYKLWLTVSLTLLTTIAKAGDINVSQGYQTTGLGNKNAVLLKVSVSGAYAKTCPEQISITLKGNTLANIDSVHLYKSYYTNFPADPQPIRLASIKPQRKSLDLLTAINKTQRKETADPSKP